LRADRDRLTRDVRAFQRQVAREIERRKRAEREAERARSDADRSASEAASAKADLRRLSQRPGQVGEGAVSAREWRELRGRVKELAEQNSLLTRDYSAVKGALQGLKERNAERWTEGKLKTRELRPVTDDEPVIVEPPVESDDRPAAEKVRIPSDPHHWPGGSTRFRTFLTRIARCEYVTRVVPRTFLRPTRHGIAFVDDEGDLVAYVSAGDHAAEVLILTTASHRGQGEHIRAQLEPIFTEWSV
jgi:hypothetical protein